MGLPQLSHAKIMGPSGASPGGLGGHPPMKAKAIPPVRGESLDIPERRSAQGNHLQIVSILNFKKYFRNFVQIRKTQVA